jgi:aspartyl protease family protein
MHDDDLRNDDSAGGVPGRRILWPTLRYAFILVGFAAVVAGGLAYRADLSDMAVVVGEPRQQTSGRPERTRAVEDGGRKLVVRPGTGGHFMLDAFVNGEAVRFVVDTGASKVALSPDDAERLGFESHALEFSERYQTANGVARGAPVTLREVRIGQLSLHEVRATVMAAPMPISLLGLSFLGRLAGHEVRDGKLILRW